MNLNGKGINLHFYFHGSLTKYSISFYCEYNALVLVISMTCHQWISQ